MKKRACAVPIRLAVFSLAAVLFIVTGALARPTTEGETKTVVLNWLSSEAKPMNSDLGGQIKRVQSFADPEAGLAYYVVFLNPAGLVFVPADDLVEPIIGFVSGATTYSPSSSNPLGALVSRDIPGRVLKARGMEASAAPQAVFPSPDTPWEKARSKWNQLESPVLAEKTGTGLLQVSDVRIAPLVQSKWGQTGADSSYDPHPCYNYYTPPYTAGQYNYPCGCSATAMAQIFRFWEYPKAGVGTTSFQIKVDGETATRSLRGGDGSGGPYNWAEMPLTTSSKTSTAQCQAIGALSADAGVSIGMKYSESGSSAWAYGYAFTDTFGYGNAIFAYNSGDNFPENNLLATLNPNLDARYPLIIDIKGSGGHSVVCDGYGYNTSTLYHHLNMGWLGKSDAWYNLPNVETGSYTYSSVYGATYNIFVTGAGEIISGRVTDSSGNPVSGAVVTGTAATGVPYNATTDANGIYALIPVPSASTYSVNASKAGYTFPGPQTVSTGTSTQKTVTTGNVWGINFVGN